MTTDGWSQERETVGGPSVGCLVGKLGSKFALGCDLGGSDQCFWPASGIGGFVFWS